MEPTNRLSLEPARLPPPALRSTLQAAPQPKPQGAVVGGRSARGERGRGAEEAKRGFGRLGDKQNERGFKRLKDSVSLLRWIDYEERVSTDRGVFLSSEGAFWSLKGQRGIKSC